MAVSVTKPLAASLNDYVQIARPDHWFKNIFMIPGIIMAYMYLKVPPDAYVFVDIILGIISTCLIASANYVINEWLDAEFDKHHPIKKDRTCLVKAMNPKLIYLEYAFLALLGLVLAAYISEPFFFAALSLLIMGVLYNVRPFRTKERAYLDVLSESINNPIRFILGWLILVPSVFPPSSILVAYWMGGAFLMACKRFAEYRHINDKATAALYRNSFKNYSELSLLLSTFFYALTSTFFLGIFLIKHRIELLLTFPLFAILFSWYLYISFKPNSSAQRPEKLYADWKFMVFIVIFFFIFMSLLFIRIEPLHYFLKNNFG